jgi:hypothetical protein
MTPQPDPRPAASDSQLAAWLDDAARHGGHPAGVSDLDDLDALTSLAAEVLGARGAVHRIEQAAVYVLHDGSGEALLAVDPERGPRLCGLTFRFPWNGTRSPGEALHWLLAAADAETSRLDTYLATGGRHQDAALLREETARAEAAAALADEDALEELVHDIASQRGSDACNGDPAGFLVAELGPDGAVAAISGLPRQEARP